MLGVAHPRTVFGKCKHVECGRKLPLVRMRSPRPISPKASTAVRNDGLRSVDVVLRDISQGGASLEIQAQAIGLGKVQLSLSDLPPIAGVVR